MNETLRGLALFTVVAVLFALVTIAYVASTYIKLAGLPPDLPLGLEIPADVDSNPPDEYYWTLLLVGVDIESTDVQTSARTDVIMLVSAHANTGQIRVLFIPRDTYVYIPTHGVDKINHALALGGGNTKDTGIWLTIATVERLLDMVAIDNYAIFYLDSIPRIVDRLGGVEFGGALLSGQETLAYLRWRGDGRGDIGRIARQQELLLSLAEQLPRLRPGFALLHFVLGEIRTDVSHFRAVQYASLFSRTTPEHIELFTVPGKAVMKNHISYWEPDLAALAPMVQYILYQRGLDETEGGDGP